MLMKVVIDRAIPFIKGVLEPFAEVVYADGINFSREIVADADALIIRTRTKCNAALLECSKVRIIATATIGFDHIDLDYCKEHGIEVATAAGCNARGVLQWVSAVLAYFSKQKGFSPKQKTLGIVGVGNVGSIVKEYAENWGFKTICCDPPRKLREGGDFVSLEEVLASADIVTLHTPLDSTTRGMINSTTIQQLKHNAILINASRGEVAESQALLREDLTLAIDVWEHEPNIDQNVLQKAVISTPHIAGYSLQGKANASALAVRAVAKHLNLPLTEWYPKGVERVAPKELSWQEMVDSIESYCNIVKESAPLKKGESFEALRDNYNYRKEYF